MARVFTGYVDLPGSHQVIHAKLNVLAKQIGQKEEFEALFTLSLGPRESVTLYYPRTEWNVDSQTLKLDGQADAQLSLDIQNKGTHAEGAVVSPLYGAVGRVYLIAGTEAPRLPVTPTTELAGRYVGQCPFKQTESAAGLIQLRLFPKRAFAKETKERSLSQLTYVGDGICSAKRTAQNCGLIKESIYDIYRSEFRFNLNGSQWRCQRVLQDRLACESDTFQPCVLEKAEPLP